MVLAPVPLTVLRSNSKFDQNLKCSSLKCTEPITTRFCTRHDSYTVAWRVHNFVVIGWVHIELECCIFWSNNEFVRNIVSGTGARSDVWIWLAKKNMIFQPTYQVWLWIVFEIPWVPLHSVGIRAIGYSVESCINLAIVLNRWRSLVEIDPVSMLDRLYCVRMSVCMRVHVWMYVRAFQRHKIALLYPPITFSLSFDNTINNTSLLTMKWHFADLLAQINWRQIRPQFDEKRYELYSSLSMWQILTVTTVH